MRSMRVTSFAAAAALATVLVAGCNGDDTAAPAPTTTATTSGAASTTASTPTSSSGTTAAAGNTKQVCAKAEESLSLITEDKMKSEVIAEAQRNGGNGEKAAITVFKKSMLKIAAVFTSQAQVATDSDLSAGLTGMAKAITTAVGQVKSLADLENLDKSKALTSSEATAAGDVLTDKCGGKFADGF